MSGPVCVFLFSFGHFLRALVVLSFFYLFFSGFGLKDAAGVFGVPGF